MKSVISLRLLYLVLLFGMFCIPADTVYATLCTEGPNTPGNHTISGTCTLANTVDGPVNGDVIIATSSAVTIGDGYTLTFPPGKMLKIWTGVTINIAKSGAGGKIKKATSGMCLTDSDADNYPASIAVSSRTIGPCVSPKKLISDIITAKGSLIADCNDAASSANNTCCGDADTPSTVGSDLYGTTCKKCVSNTLTNQTNAEDLFSQCTNPGTCQTGGNCNGSGSCTGIGYTGYGSCGTNCCGGHYVCNGSGGCIAPITVSGCLGYASGHTADWGCSLWGYAGCYQAWEGGNYICLGGGTVGCYDTNFSSSKCWNYTY